MSLRPDLVECWVFRVVPPATPDDARSDADRLEILLVRRAFHRIFPGLWQCVTGGIDSGERVPDAALREVREETGFGAAEIECAYDLDQVAPFYDEASDAVVVSAIFAARRITRGRSCSRLGSKAHFTSGWAMATRLS